MNFKLNDWQLKRREIAAKQSLLNQSKRRPWLRSVNEFNGGCGATGVGGILTSSTAAFYLITAGPIFWVFFSESEIS